MATILGSKCHGALTFLFSRFQVSPPDSGPVESALLMGASVAPFGLPSPHKTAAASLSKPKTIYTDNVTSPLLLENRVLDKFAPLNRAVGPAGNSHPFLHNDFLMNKILLTFPIVAASLSAQMVGLLGSPRHLNTGAYTLG